MSDYNIGLGIEDRFSSALKSLQTQMAMVSNAASASDENLQKLQKSAENLAGVNTVFAGLSKSVTAFTESVANGGDSTANFQKMVDNLRGAQDQYAKKTVDAAQATVESASSAREASLSFGEMAAAMAAGSLAADIIQGTLGKVVSTIMSIPSQGMAMNASLEQSKIAFTSMLGSASEADKLLKDLWNFAATTPFEFPQLISAAQRMKAFGYETSQIIPIMTSVGNIAASLGASGEMVQRMTYSLGQMKAMGRVTGMELRELSMAGVNLSDIYAIVAKNMGKTTEQIKAMMTGGRGAGALPFEEFLKAFQEFGMSGKFGNAMEMQAKTFNGAMSTIRDNLSAVIRDGFTPLFAWVSKLTYQFSMFVQGEQFAEIIKKIQYAAQRLADVLPTINAETFVQVGNALANAVNKLVDFANFLRDNFKQALETITGILFLQFAVGLGTAIPNAAMTAVIGLKGVLTILSALAAHPVVAAFALIVGGLILIKKHADDMTVAAQKVNDAHEKTAVILGDLGAEYRKLSEEQARFQQRDTGMMSPEDTQRFDYVNERLIQLERQANLTKAATRAALYTTFAGDQNEAYTPRIESPTSIVESDYAEQASKFKIGMEVVYKLAADARMEIGKTYDKVAESVVNASKQTLLFANQALQSLGVVKEPAAVFASAMEKVGSAMQVLDAKQQSTFLGAAKNIQETFFKTGDLNTALIDMQGILDNITIAADKAASSERWKTMLTTLAAGVAGPLDAYKKALAQPVGKGYDAGDFKKAENAQLDKQRKIAEIEENIRRVQGISASKKDNWSTPDPDVIAKYRREIEDLNIDLEDGNKKIQDMKDSNANLGSEAVKAYTAMREAYAKVVSGWILGQETQGKISAQQADALIAQTDKMFGVESMSVGEKLQRLVQQQIKGMGEFTEKNTLMVAQWLADATAAADPIAAFKEKQAAYNKEQQQAAQLAKDQQKILKDNNALGDDATANAEKFAKRVAEQEDPLKKVRDYLSDSKKFLEDMVRQAWNIKVVIVGGTGNEGGGENPPHPPSPGMKWVKVGGVWTEVPKEQGNNLDSTDSNNKKYNSATDSVDSSRTAVDNVISNIQYMLDKFKQLSQDPRIAEMANVTSAVIGAIRSSVELMAGLVKYTAPARANVDAAFSDMVYIAGRLISWGNDIIGAYDWEKLGNLASAANGLLGAFGTSVDAFAKLKEYTSPARALIDTVIDDIIAVVTALKTRLPEDLTESAGNALAAFGNGFGAILGPLAQMGSYIGLARNATTGMSPALESFMSDLQGLFGRMKYLSDWLVVQGDLKEKMAELGVTLAAIMEPLTVALGVLGGVGTYSPLKRVGGISQDLENFVGDIAGLMGRLKSLSTALGDTAAIKKMGESMSAVFDPLKTITEVMVEIGKYVALVRDSSGIATKLDSFMSDVSGLMGRLATLSGWLSGQTNAQGQIAPQMMQLGVTMSAVFGGMNSVFEVFRNLKDYESMSATEMSSILDSITTSITLIISKFSEWVSGASHIEEINGVSTVVITSIPLEITKKMTDFATAMSTILSPISTLLGVLTGLHDYAKKLADKASPIGPALEAMNTGLRAILEQMTQWVTGADSSGQNPTGAPLVISEAMKKLAEDLAVVLAPFSNMIGTLSAMMDYAQKARHNTTQIATILPQFFADMKLIVNTFMDTIWPDVSNMKDETLSTINGIVSTVGGMIALLGSLRQYLVDAKDQSGNIPEAIVAIVADIQLAVTEYIAKISHIDGIDDIEAETVTTVGNIMSALKNGLDLFSGLQKYKKVPAEKLSDFMDDMKEAIKEFIEKVIPEFASIDTEVVGKVSGAVSSIVSSLGGALALFTGLLAYGDVPQTTIRLFMDDVKYAVTQFVELIMPPIVTSGAETAEKVGTAVNSIVTSLTNAVNFFNLLNANGGFKDVAIKGMDNLKVALVGADGTGGLVEKFGQIAAGINRLAEVDVPAMSSTISGMVESLGKSLSFFKDLNDFTAVPEKACENLVVSFLGLAKDGSGGVVGAIKQINNGLTDTVQSGIAKFAGSMTTVGGAFTAAINTLSSIATYSAPMPAKFQQFVNDIVGGGTGAAATIGVLGLLTQIAARWNTDAESAANTFKSAINAIKQPIADAMALLTAIRTDSTTPIMNMQAFITAMTTVLTNMQTLATTAGSIDITDLMSKLGTISGTMGSTLFNFDRMWFSAGRSWIQALINGMRAMEDDLVGYLAHISALLPHSPADEGPLSEPVNWDSYLTAGLGNAVSSINDGLAELGNASAPNVPANIRSGNTITVDLRGSTFSSPSDEDRIIRKLTQALKGQGVAL